MSENVRMMVSDLMRRDFATLEQLEAIATEMKPLFEQLENEDGVRRLRRGAAEFLQMALTQGLGIEEDVSATMAELYERAGLA